MVSFSERRGGEGSAPFDLPAQAEHLGFALVFMRGSRHRGRPMIRLGAVIQQERIAERLLGLHASE